eukprot:CAMPEP_0184728428 /NCGR_PEP_ID=MMETSP0314-20130426/40172_1 /TAXON_ID=38298 /ORGANISM="Rhodella maculata, Strain CCMP 736" /LENGTH=56 /DNA_ID=CAMNT_0027194269 /DNA_START=108 /DNA_END=278 /DNA_ORIENTATION=-
MSKKFIQRGKKYVLSASDELLKTPQQWSNRKGGMAAEWGLLKGGGSGGGSRRAGGE